MLTIQNNLAAVKPVSAAQNRVDPFLALRGLACVAVIAGHCNYRQDWTNLIQAGGRDLTFLLWTNAGAAVIVFFTLSGYLMGKLFYSGKYSLTVSGIQRFFTNRALRICPLYYTVFAILALFFYKAVVHDQAVLWHVLTFTYTNFSNVFSPQFWSLSTEVQFYLFVPLLFAIARPIASSASRAVMLLAAIVCAVESLKLFLFTHFVADGGITEAQWRSTLYAPLWANLDAFAAGFLMNPVVRFSKVCGKPQSLKLGWLVVMAGSIFCAMCKAEFPRHSIQTLIFVPSVAAACTALFILIAESHVYVRKPLSLQTIRSNPLRIFDLIGDLSYGIYLWHFAVMMQVLALTESQSDSLGRFVETFSLTLVVTTSLAALTYVVVERPFNKIRYRRVAVDANVRSEVAKSVLG